MPEPNYEPMVPREEWEPQTITSDEEKDDRGASFDFRMGLKKILEAVTEIKQDLEEIRRYEDPIQARKNLRTIVIAVLGNVHVGLQTQVSALENLRGHVKKAVPREEGPTVYADKEKWTIKIGFQYPVPGDPLKKITYGPGEPIPPNMTQEDCDMLYAQGFIYRFQAGPDGKGLYYPHPRVKQLSEAEIDVFVKSALAYAINFLDTNTFRLNTLLTMRVRAEYWKADVRLIEKIKSKIDFFENVA